MQWTKRICLWINLPCWSSDLSTTGQDFAVSQLKDLYTGQGLCLSQNWATFSVRTASLCGVLLLMSSSTEVCSKINTLPCHSAVKLLRGDNEQLMMSCSHFAHSIFIALSEVETGA